MDEDNLDRRRFLKTIAGTLPLAACSHGFQDHVDAVTRSCSSAVSGTERSLIIDTHCHLLNLKDAANAAFVNRHFVPEDLAVQGVVGGALELGSSFAGTAVMSTQNEVKMLMAAKEANLSPAQFCRQMTRAQKGMFRSRSDPRKIETGQGRVLGFTSNKSRNAALMMAFWPEVDIFMPSHVDFAEGNLWCKFGEDQNPLCQKSAVPTEGLYAYYMYLNLATHGRFLPLAPFHPRRFYEESIEKYPVNTNLTKHRMDVPCIKAIRDAIEHWGFVGVKVHPSSGFDPLLNETLACPNEPLLVRRTEVPLREQQIYDLGMRTLYEVCAELDVPILTHGSDSLAINAECTRREQNLLDGTKENPLNWPNSSQHWVQTLESPKHANFRVCLAHFASRFHDHITDRDGDYSGKIRVEYNPEGSLVLQKSEWLGAAMEYIERNPKRRDMYLDLSFMEELAYSSAVEAGQQVDRKGLFKLKYQPDARYAKAFRSFLSKNEILGKVTMYGSDWHMPGISKIGPQYRELIERVLPNSMRDDIMGRNAVRFYGLHKGARTRQRLDKFYRRHNLEPERDIPWVRKIDNG